MEDDCSGSQGPQRTVAVEKCKEKEKKKKKEWERKKKKNFLCRPMGQFWGNGSVVNFVSFMRD